MSKKKQTIIPPQEGWKEHTWYLAEVSVNKSNPIFAALFYTGFLRDGEPTNYNRVVNHTCDPFRLDQAYYLRAVRELVSVGISDVEGCDNLHKLPPKP